MCAVSSDVVDFFQHSFSAVNCGRDCGPAAVTRLPSCTTPLPRCLPCLVRCAKLRNGLGASQRTLSPYGAIPVTFVRVNTPPRDAHPIRTTSAWDTAGTHGPFCVLQSLLLALRHGPYGGGYVDPTYPHHHTDLNDTGKVWANQRTDAAATKLRRRDTGQLN